ncbi:MAG: hypothetical protein BLITH_1475 [Brockia lithotrophica]|uniref:Uncharacterized protein n=1 Tax=Brockia lithotrophica TaxID=933949 RepID=A0A2T5G5E3_9BACL|nr:MAG: hypothetical protein BLITH_1475 [Brockia lithotrophica]
MLADALPNPTIGIAVPKSYLSLLQSRKVVKITVVKEEFYYLISFFP